MNTPTAPERPSTCSSSRSRSAGSTVTTVSPASPARELEDDPLRQVVRPRGDPLARCEALRQPACRALAGRQQLRVGPAPAVRLDQRDDVRRARGGLAQQLPGRLIADHRA